MFILKVVKLSENTLQFLMGLHEVKQLFCVIYIQKLQLLFSDISLCEIMFIQKRT